MNLLLIGGGVAALLLLLANREESSSEPKLAAPIVTNNDEYETTMLAIESGTAPFDQDTFVVFHNTSYGSADPAFIEGINERAKRAGIRAVAHVFGPSPEEFSAIHYKGKEVVEELQSGMSPDDILVWLDDKGTAAVGMRYPIAIAGQRYPVAVTGARRGKTNRGAEKHMSGMVRRSGRLVKAPKKQAARRGFSFEKKSRRR